MSTAWEVIERMQVGRGTKWGDDWDKVPAVAIGKAYITINGKLYKAFGNGATSAFVMISKDSRKIGIKFVPPGEFDIHAFRIQPNGKWSKKQPGTASHKLQCKAVITQFPDAVGRAYRAHMDAQGKVVEIALTPENILR